MVLAVLVLPGIFFVLVPQVPSVRVISSRRWDHAVTRLLGPHPHLGTGGESAYDE